MFSINSINELRIWGFNKHSNETYMVFDLLRPLFDIKMSGRMLLLGF